MHSDKADSVVLGTIASIGPVRKAYRTRAYCSPAIFLETATEEFTSQSAR